MARVATEINVFWHDDNMSDQGWAYRLSDAKGYISSGSLNANRDDLDDAITSAVAIAGLELYPDAFSREEKTEGGFAYWTAMTREATPITKITLTQLADQLGYESVAWDEENDCYSGYGSSDPTDRSRDDVGALYVCADDIELEKLRRQSIEFHSGSGGTDNVRTTPRRAKP